MNIDKIAKEILSAAPVPNEKKVIVKKQPDVKQQEDKQQPVRPIQQTNISEEEIRSALDIANDLRTKLSGLLGNLEINIKDLSSSKSSVLKSKDRFKKLKVSLEKMSDELSVI